MFTVCYANAHAALVQSTCTELARGAWVIGGVGRVMTVRPNSIVRNNEERPALRDDFLLVLCHMAYKPPQADSPES